MSTQILLVLDSSQVADYVLAHAESIARALGARIILLRTLNSMSGKTGHRMVDPLDWHIRKMEVDIKLNTMAQGLRKKGMSVSTAVLEGSDAEQLIHFARTHEVELLILTKQSETPG